MISLLYCIFCIANLIMSLIWLIGDMFWPAAICVSTAILLAGVAIDENNHSGLK